MRKALVIGLNNYPTAPLYGCINDAKEISRLLEYNQDHTINFSVQLITDERQKVDKVNLKKSIVELFNGDGTVLLYFSGHGLNNESGGYIVTPDYQKYDEGISMAEILNFANNSKAKNKIIILDCCYSGNFGNFNVLQNQAALIGSGVTILTACKSDETSVEKHGRGLFTNLLIDALEGGAADLSGNVTPGSIYWYVDKALGPWEQRPVFKTNVTAYTPIRQLKPPIPIEKLRKLIVYFQSQDDEYHLDPTYEFTEPLAIPKHVEILKDLQKFVSVGLVKPVEEEHMYFAAINSKSCKLTTLGKCYWHFITDKRI